MRHVPGRHRAAGHPLLHLQRSYQSYEEKIKGSIEVGKLADLIICDRDILAMDTHELHNVKVDLTMIDGKVEYQRV